MKASVILIGLLAAAVAYLYLTKGKPQKTVGSVTSGTGRGQVGSSPDDFQAGAAAFTSLIQLATSAIGGGRAQTGPRTDATPADATPPGDDLSA